MKKNSIIFIAALFITGYSIGQNFSQLSFLTINGDTVQLNSFAGKKTLFFIAALNQSDLAFAQLQAFKSRYLDTVRIVGVMSYEDGYQSSNASSIQSMYNSMGIILTGGMYTKKSAGSNQSSLMKWLTDKTKNMHFDNDSNGIGQKFFVTESGRLFAVMPGQTSLQNPIIDKIVHNIHQ